MRDERQHEPNRQRDLEGDPDDLGEEGGRAT